MLKIRDKFKPGDNMTDYLILYEVTNYVDGAMETDFLSEYRDFVQSHEQDALVRRDKIQKSDRAGQKVSESWTTNGKSLASKMKKGLIKSMKRISNVLPDFQKVPDKPTNNLGIQEEDE